VAHALLLQLIVAERGPLVFVFNFSPFNNHEGYKVWSAAPLFATSTASKLWSLCLLMPASPWQVQDR